MELDDIPADVEMLMTPELERLFKMARCNPMCHACSKDIVIGELFMLASVNDYRISSPVDKMIGSCCTKDKLQGYLDDEKRKWETRGRGYTRIHKAL